MRLVCAECGCQIFYIVGHLTTNGSLRDAESIKCQQCGTEPVLHHEFTPPSRTALESRLAEILRHRGEWVTWRRYSTGQQDQAKSAVNDIRRGKVKALAELDVAVRNRRSENGESIIEVKVPALG